MNKNDFKKSLDDLWESIQEIDHSTKDGQEKIRAKMIEYINMTSAHSESEIKVLYAGSVNGFNSSKIAENIADSSKYGQNLQYGVLDKTEVFSLLTSEDFKNIHGMSFGYSNYKEMSDKLEERHGGRDSDGYRNSPEMQFAFHGTSGYWAIASKNFIEQNKGHIIVLTQNPREQSVVMQTEIPTAIKSGNYETINGIKISNLIGNERAKYNILDISVKSTVLSNIGIQEINGKNQVVNLDDFSKMASNHELLNNKLKYATPEQQHQIIHFTAENDKKELTIEPKRVIELKDGQTWKGLVATVGEHLTYQERPANTIVIHQTKNLPDNISQKVGTSMELTYGADGKATITKEFEGSSIIKEKLVEKSSENQHALSIDFGGSDKK